jgi:hypothetical protein
VRSIAAYHADFANSAAGGQNWSVGSGCKTKLHAIIDQLKMDSDSNCHLLFSRQPLRAFLVTRFVSPHDRVGW